MVSRIERLMDKARRAGIVTADEAFVIMAAVASVSDEIIANSDSGIKFKQLAGVKASQQITQLTEWD
jgi:hypothetical protein